MSTIRIKPLLSLQEMRDAVELQKIYWGNDIESVVPAHMLFSIVNTGGHVLAALDDDRIVGVLIGLIGIDIYTQSESSELVIASKRMVVLPEYRSQGIGQKLKSSQRDAAIKQGIRLVSWTFDPLLATNANLNLHKLGGISRTYLEDYYGKDDSTGLATLGYSDRLSVEWWVSSQHVEEKLKGNASTLTLDSLLENGSVIINPSISSANSLLPGKIIDGSKAEIQLVEIPLDYPSMVQNDPNIAIAWREQTRSIFRNLIESGYILVDFIRGRYEGRDRACYVLKQHIDSEYYSG